MKKLLVAGIFIFLLSPSALADFPDIDPDSEHAQAIDALQELRIIQGYPDGTFREDKKVSRAEFLKMMALTEKIAYERGRPQGKFQSFPGVDNFNLEESCFSDFEISAWFAKYVCWAFENQIVSGYPQDEEFKGEKTVNVAEAAKMMNRKNEHDKDYYEEMEKDHWAQAYFLEIKPQTLPTSIQSADKLLSRGETVEILWREYIATNEELEEKESHLLAWSPLAKAYLPINYIGSTYHYVERVDYGKYENDIYFVISPWGRLVEMYAQKLPEADASTFKVYKLNKYLHIATDDNYVFNYGKLVEGSAGGEFHLLDEKNIFIIPEFSEVFFFYGADQKHAYLIGCYEGCHLGKPLPNSEIGTFTALKNGYSKDKNQVYYGDSVLQGANPSTFDSLGLGYGKDGETVYFWGENFEEVEVDNFEVLSTDHNVNFPISFAQDSEFIYLGDTKTDLDKTSFKIIDDYARFVQDKGGIYRVINEVPMASHAFFPDSVLKLEVDSETFDLFGAYYYGDGKTIYRINNRGEITPIESVDYESFNQDFNSSYPENGYFSGIAKDKNAVYLGNKIIQGVDAATFIYDDEENKWKDKDGSYSYSDLKKLTE